MASSSGRRSGRRSGPGLRIQTWGTRSRGAPVELRWLRAECRWALCWPGGRLRRGRVFRLDVVEPLGVGHGGAGGEHADPGAVGGLSEEDGDAEAAGEDGEAGDVVLMLVGDEDGVEFGGVLAG